MRTYTEFLTQIRSGEYNYPEEFVKAIEEEEKSRKQWRRIFSTGLIVLVFGGLYIFIHKTTEFLFEWFVLSIFTFFWWLLPGDVFTNYKALWTEYVEACEILRANPESFAKKSAHHQQIAIRERLSTFGRRLLEAEISHPEDPGHEDRVDARDIFVSAYSKFVSAGLLEDVGYSEFFPKKKENS